MNTLLLEGLVESLSYFKGYEIFKYPTYHLGFPVFLVLLVLNLCLSFYNNKSVNIINLNFCLMSISNYSELSVNAKWMETTFFFPFDLALTCPLSLADILFSVSPCADILWVLDKMLKPCMHIFSLAFPMFCIFFS